MIKRTPSIDPSWWMDAGHLPAKVTPHAIVRAVEAAATLLRDSRSAGTGPRVLPEGVSETIQAVIDEFGRRALAGDHDAARVVLQAAQRKAEAEGTDAPQRFRGEANLRLIFGDGSPDDMPPELQQAVYEHYKSKRETQGYIPEAPPELGDGDVGAPYSPRLVISHGAGDGAGEGDAEVDTA